MSQWKSVRIGILLAAVVSFGGCNRDAPTVPTQTGPLSATSLLTRADSAAALAASVANPGSSSSALATVTTIKVGAGESLLITVLSTECSGDPETVRVYGVMSSVVASGSCASLSGTQVSLGPAGADGTISFKATHQIYGEGPAGQVTGSAPEFTVGMNDGYPGDVDYNDVVISVRIVCPPTNDRVLDNPNFASRIDSAMKLSNISGPLGSRLEAWFFAYDDPTAPGGVRFGFPTNVGSTECTSAIAPPDSLSIFAVIHTHPHYIGDDMYQGCGIKGAKKYNPRENGGGSDQDWEWRRFYGRDVYAVGPQMTHLLLCKRQWCNKE